MSPVRRSGEPLSGKQATLEVHVQPRASRNAVVGWRGSALAVRLTAPPVDSAANRACQELLAEVLGVKCPDVELLSGKRSREKRFAIHGVTDAQLQQILRDIVGESTQE